MHCVREPNISNLDITPLSNSYVVTTQFTNTNKARCYFNRDDYKLFQMNEAIISGSDDPHGLNFKEKKTI